MATTTRGTVRARHVVIAAGPLHSRRVPAAAAGLDPTVQQLHSAHYRRPADVTGWDVLVVGGGNSAAQLAVELAATHRVSVAAPSGMWFLPARILGISLYWWIFLTGVLNGASGTPVSRQVRKCGDGIIGGDLQRLVADGTGRLLTERVVSATGTTVTLDGGSTESPDSVLWCTGFGPDYPWLDVPGAVDDDGRPVQHGGRSAVPDLHWMGLPWQTRLNSAILDGVDRDAQALVARLDDSGNPPLGVQRRRQRRGHDPSRRLPDRRAQDRPVAPQIALASTTGSEVQLTDFRGRSVLLCFQEGHFRTRGAAGWAGVRPRTAVGAQAPPGSTIPRMTPAKRAGGC